MFRRSSTSFNFRHAHRPLQDARKETTSTTLSGLDNRPPARGNGAVLLWMLLRDLTFAFLMEGLKKERERKRLIVVSLLINPRCEYDSMFVQDDDDDVV